MQVCQMDDCEKTTSNGYDVCPVCYKENSFMNTFFEDNDWTLQGVSELQGLPDCINDASRYAVFEKDTRLKLVPVHEIEP